MKLTIEQQMLRAATVATRAHHGQKRKDGTPYIAHPVRVAIRCEDRLAKVVALLHDVIEDCDVTLMDLREAGFTEDVIAAVDSVTKRAGETYMKFVERARDNEIGKQVKIADIADNLEDQSALDPDEATFLRDRYGRALAFLQQNHLREA